MGARGARRRERNPFGALAAVAERAASRATGFVWPSKRYQRNPAAFCREVLGFEPWSAQIEILEAVRDHRNVTVKSGHKIGKSTIVAALALWFFCSFERACVPITAVKATQIDDAVWKEVRRLHRGARIPIGGELNLTSRAGLRDSLDDRRVWGLTAQSSEGAAGISGPNVFLICDEASGIHDKFFEVVGSSLAGSGGTVRKIYIGNPTRTVGEFWKSHNTNAKLFKAITVSSEDTPNARGTGSIPGLAGPEWIAEKRIEYGPESAEYAIRVQGKFATGFDGKICPGELLDMAEEAYPLVAFEGPLAIGVDPAGDSTTGDASAFAVRRGLKVSTVQREFGLSTDSIVVRVVDHVRANRLHREVELPRVVLDAEGPIGAEVEQKLNAHLASHPGEFDLVVVRGSKVKWGSLKYDLVRDEVFGQTRDFLNAGGAIPTIRNLREDLGAATFTEIICRDKRRRLSATPKKHLRKELGRSPDEGDACMLAIYGWQGSTGELDEEHDRAAAQNTRAAVVAQDLDDELSEGGAFDPYAGAALWQGGR